MTTLYNGQFYLQGLNTTVPGITGITSADTILSVLNNIQTNIPSTVMMEIGSYNQNVANGTPIYKYLMGFSNSASGLGGYYTMDGITKSSSVRFLTMYQSGGNVQVGINTASPLYTLDVNGSIHAANTLIVDSATTLKNTLNVQSATVLSNTLTVQNATTLNDRLTVNGETKIDNTLFVVYGATFNNTLTVQSATVLNNTLTVGNATTLSRLTVNATTINDTLYVQNGTTLNDTLKVRNATTLSNTLSVTGATTATGLITANGGLQVNGYANATGLITGGAGLSITGATTLYGSVLTSVGFYGNGSGLTSVNAATATIATTATTATIAGKAINPNTISSSRTMANQTDSSIVDNSHVCFPGIRLPTETGIYAFLCYANDDNPQVTNNDSYLGSMTFLLSVHAHPGPGKTGFVVSNRTPNRIYFNADLRVCYRIVRNGNVTNEVTSIDNWAHVTTATDSLYYILDFDYYYAPVDNTYSWTATFSKIA